jgi:hypothetical protein
VDFGRVAPFGPAAAGQHGGRVGQPHGGGDDRLGIDGAVGVQGDGLGQAAGRAEHTGGGDVLEDQGPGVDRARIGRQADVADPAARLDQLGGQRRQVHAGGSVDDRVERPARQRVPHPHLLEAQRPGEPQRPLLLAEQVHVGAARPGDQRRQQPDGARAHDQQPLARADLGDPDHAQRVTARLDQGPGRGPDGVREWQQR